MSHMGLSGSAQRVACLRARQMMVRSIMPIAAILVAALLASTSALAGNLDRVILFNIQASTLDEALLQFGEQAHIQISFASDSANAPIAARQIKGRYRGREVLMKLLQGTQLRFIAHGNIVEITTDAQITSVHSTAALKDPDPTDIHGQNMSGNQDTASAAKKRVRKPTEPILHEITITGTRVVGVEPVGVPVHTISQTQIRDSGYATLDQLLQSLPDDFRGGSAGASPDAQFSRGANSGYNATLGSGVNLFGVGNDATLVLVNGHRVAPSGSGFFTDISTIPLSAIDHVDVLTDGSSALYGSDAIAGVVNIALKQNEKGTSADLRYGVGSGFGNYDGSILFGRQWSSGGIVLDADYSGQGALDVRDRSFTDTVQSPTSILPMSHQVWLSATGHQRVAEHLEIRGDVEYSDTKRQYEQSYSLPAGRSDANVPRWSGTFSATQTTSSSWVAGADVAAGEGLEEIVGAEFPDVFRDEVREVSRFTEPGIHASGNLLPLPAGSVKLAVGGSYLVQDFSHLDFNPASANRYAAGRHVTAGYGELWIPIVGEANSAPGIARLTVSAAGRYDRYSDFGSTTNYKVGISWFPKEQLQIRGAYSTSFRAPAVGQELVDSEQGTTGLLLFPILNPQQTGETPVLFLEGAVPHLKPETATNLTVGVDYIPAEIPGLRVSVTYYRILYSAQLASAPFSETGLSDPALEPVITEYASAAPIEALVAANAALYYDATGGLFGANPLADTRYVYDLRIGNLSRTDTSGFDASGRYAFTAGLSRIDLTVDATYIRDFFTQLTPESPELEEVNTVGYPADLRMTAQASLTRGRGTVALTGSYVNSYPDTTGSPPGRVGSYVTLDLVCRYALSGEGSSGRGATVSIMATNLLNRNPPYVENGSLGIAGVHYDVANASPLGRVVSLEIAKRW